MIVSVAIKIDGVVYALAAPNRHHDVIRMLFDEGFPTPICGEQGFVTDSGKFMRRAPAEHYARKIGQLTKPRIGSVLTSEDLW